MDYIKQNWTSKEQKEFSMALQQMGEQKYKEFNQKMVKTNMPMIGIRVPKLREIAKQITKGNALEFIRTCIPVYYEELMILGIVIGTSNIEYEQFVLEMNDFVKRIENWAVCDTFCTSIKKQVENNKEAFWNYITLYLRSKNNWIVRVALVIMLCYYLEEKYIEQVFKRCESVKRDFYGVNMAQAWLIATAWVKCPEQTKEYLLHSTLDKWTFNKAIQKACESSRVTKQDKIYLKTLKK